MYSEKAITNAEACRFCWMCRHICPVGQVTGKEIDTPRAKGLLVSLDVRGLEYDQSFANAMYECLLCNSCANDCVTGFEPSLFIREGRTKAVVEGLTPPKVNVVIQNILTSNNIYGMPAEKRFESLEKELNGLHEKSKTLLYIGEVAAYKTPKMAAALISLFKKANVDFMVLKNELPSGAYLGDLMGYVEEVRAQAVACANLFDISGANTIIVLEPTEAAIMKQKYPEFGCQTKAEIVTATSFVSQLLAEKKLTPKSLSIGPVTYHDPARLARDIDEVVPSRDIINSMQLELREMFLNKRLSRCSGSALMNEYDPFLNGLTSEKRWADAIRTGAKTLLVSSPESYLSLKNRVPENMKLECLFTLLNQACSI